MSLLKRLLLSVTAAMLIILAGTLAFSIGAARQYLDSQLRSESENMVSSLALSLSQPANQDPVTRELLMTALFDSGQLHEIRLTASDGADLFARQQSDEELAGQEAPQWFSRLLPLTQPRAERVISDGWRQVGQISLVVGNGSASYALWQGSLRMTVLILAAGVAWALFVATLLKWFRRVLNEEISAQVRTIGTQARRRLPAHSRMAELSSLVSVIDDTRERARVRQKEQTQRIESLELEINRDPITQLPNRRYFINELRKALEGGAGKASHGHVLLFRQRDLQALNASMTRAQVDAWLVNVGRRVGDVLAAQAAAGEYPQDSGFLARLNGSDFAVLMPGLQGPRVTRLVQQIRQVLQSLRVPMGGVPWCRWAYALTDYASSSSTGEVFARLDHALMRTESAGHAEVEYVVHSAREAERSSAGESEWQHTLAAALAEPQRLSLDVHEQTYLGPQGRVEHHEAWLQLHENTRDGESQAMAGSLFLPVAVRLGLSAEFDLSAVALGLHWLTEQRGGQLIVRISLPSLAQADFLVDLNALLDGWERKDTANTLSRLILELDAHGAVAYPDELLALCAQVRDRGVRTGLRRLDQAPGALLHLHALPLAYVKLGGDFVIQSHQNPGTRHLMMAMVSTARELGASVYVTGFLDMKIAEWLVQHGASVPA
ncbi:MAG: LapD/MoxY N-terminal periplasmic domain-containing protein [Ottowia sp.]|uniref:bifunctional diguanylate cyclase/phosphodiesterase n=1 Tax=Ottowia sp. TaxID=1898956 RepID=UPI003C749B28